VRIGLRSGGWVLAAMAALTALTVCAVARAQDSQVQQKTDDLANASLEDLMKVEVTSVSNKEQTLSRTAAAVFVITQEDIARSGATNIPDVLRIAPGLDVAQINASTWAVSARGLNGQFSNELLVLIDGRNVYTPSFGGVFWDTLDLPLENIERIEVIRGPGASIWGENAVNGVVNIIRWAGRRGRHVLRARGRSDGRAVVGAGARAGAGRGIYQCRWWILAVDLEAHVVEPFGFHVNGRVRRL
jgi:outer membrane receptor for ferrienterochelin and colicin